MGHRRASSRRDDVAANGTGLQMAMVRNTGLAVGAAAGIARAYKGRLAWH